MEEGAVGGNANDLDDDLIVGDVFMLIPGTDEFFDAVKDYLLTHQQPADRSSHPQQ